MACSADGGLKRAFDIAAAAALLVLLAPLMAVVALLVLLTMGRPVLFVQTRAGLGGSPFRMYKFRTMRQASGPDGRPLPDSERVTPLGRALRRLSLDELPQLWNVLKGEMSLVGPRPLPVEYVERYSPEQRRRLEVRPGITGWAQVNGRNRLGWEETFRLDVWYIDNRSFLLDLRILAVTAVKILLREGAASERGETREEFGGSSPSDIPDRYGAKQGRGSP
ncbi:MAG: sugar transferase [Planctomycetota bacterium]|nr:sugar transferase [Planctomycetota bacterium]